MLSELALIRNRVIDPVLCLHGMLGQIAPGLDDAQRAMLHRLCDMAAFQKLCWFDIFRKKLTADQFVGALREAYPSVTWGLPDSAYWVTGLPDLKLILVRNWVSELQWLADEFDCDDFGAMLFTHLSYYWRLNSAWPVWGDTDRGYHGFNVMGLWDRAEGRVIVRLIEPQTDAVFTTHGPLGVYVPREARKYLGRGKFSS